MILLQTSFGWGKKNDHTYSGKIDMEGLFSKNSEGLRMADFTIKPSNILVSDTLWQFESSKIHFDSTRIDVSNFNLHHKDEFFRINGKLTDNQTDKMNIEAQNINLGFFDLVSKQKIGIEGSLDGTTEIADINNSFFSTATWLSGISISIKTILATLNLTIFGMREKSGCIPPSS